MSGKRDKQFFFEAKLNWLSGTRGLLNAKGAAGAIHVATPAAFGGEGNSWSPEHLFLSSIIGCFMSTFIAFTQKLDFDIVKLECSAIGQIEIVEGKYKFTHINLYPKLLVANNEVKERAKLALEKTQKYCLISNSVNAAILYHSQILIEPVKYQV